MKLLQEIQHPLKGMLRLVIWLILPFFAQAQTIRIGNSYVNISKKNTGGVVEPGDTLEIRMTVHITAGTAYRFRYLDNVPTNTQMLTGTADSIRVITNEGLTYKNIPWL
ncbi:hypothetical protein [Terrimonas pollutisoli]|uniref:hypothetical protein n=1 Tax=Terrimonas pollutisoli TaxID=3034147 RepID=UPI0023EDFAA0|nr:hypothetical protein [Terrimonas sp. H1YJ31]